MDHSDIAITLMQVTLHCGVLRVNESSLSNNCSIVVKSETCIQVLHCLKGA